MRENKFVVASREYEQVGIDLKFKVIFRCSVCDKEVEPDRLRIGRRHVHALHCEQWQEIGCVA